MSSAVIRSASGAFAELSRSRRVATNPRSAQQPGTVGGERTVLGGGGNIVLVFLSLPQLKLASLRPALESARHACTAASTAGADLGVEAEAASHNLTRPISSLLCLRSVRSRSSAARTASAVLATRPFAV